MYHVIAVSSLLRLDKLHSFFLWAEPNCTTPGISYGLVLGILNLVNNLLLVSL